MTRECYTIVEDFEEDIENWYWGDQKRDIVEYLCRDAVLRKEESGNTRINSHSKSNPSCYLLLKVSNELNVHARLYFSLAELV